MGDMSKLLNESLKKIIVYACIVLVCTIPVYYVSINWLWRYELNEHNIVLTAEAGREDSYRIIIAVTLITVLFSTLLLGGFILLNRRISGRLWRPFYQSLEEIKNFDLTRPREITFEETHVDEFRELHQSLHKLISGNITVFNQQKEFADNASHELQTPLAVIQSQLDLLLQSKSLSGEQYAIIEDAYKALSRVSRINKNLLLLTKIENSQFMDKQMIALPDLLEETIATFLNFSEAKQLEIKLDMLPGVMVEGNKIVIEILLNNLITNAIRHTPPNGIIAITLSANSLVVKNTGATPLKQDQLFKRFGTTSAQTPGTGLGLALVKQICNRYNWKISYTFNNGQHTFSLDFNLDFLPNQVLTMQDNNPV
jgi:signal transduction histidine kinase